jgi:microcystin-dependent protein
MAGNVYGALGMPAGSFYYQGTGTYYGSENSGSQGYNQPHNNMPPYLTLHYIIFVGK